jgi:hypothetical protein
MNNSDVWNLAKGREEEFSSYICSFLKTELGLSVKGETKQQGSSPQTANQVKTEDFLQ